MYILHIYINYMLLPLPFTFVYSSCIYVLFYVYMHVWIDLQLLLLQPSTTVLFFIEQFVSVQMSMTLAGGFCYFSFSVRQFMHVQAPTVLVEIFFFAFSFPPCFLLLSFS